MNGDPHLRAHAVDWEQRVDLDRLRKERLGRLNATLEASSLGSLLTFDFSNIRYMTATHIGTWAMDKLIRFAVLPRGGEPVLWDFGSAAKHHQLFNPWLDGTERARAGISTLRGAFHPEAGIAEEVARKVATVLREHGLESEPLGVDLVEMPILAALHAEGLDVVDGQQVFLEARRIKTPDEISLLTQACSMVDAAYEDLYDFLRPGVRENECVGVVSKALYDLGSEYVEGVNAISGERCSPHPHVYSDRVIRPGDPAFFDILHSHLGYRTCYLPLLAVGSASPAMRDAYTRCREYMDAAIAIVRPGTTTADVVGCGRPRRVRFLTRKRPSRCSTATAWACPSGRSRSSAAWSRSTTRRCSRRAWSSRSRPTGPPATLVRRQDREELVVTDDGCEVIASFPQRTSWSPASATGPSTAHCRRCATRSPTSHRRGQG